MIPLSIAFLNPKILGFLFFATTAENYNNLGRKM